MVDSLSRRSVLRACGITATTVLSGCSFGDEEVTGGRLFVENFLPADYRVMLAVTEGTDTEGNEIVDSWYRMPANHALQFEGVIESGTAYTVTVHRPTVAPEDSVTVTIPACEGDGDYGRDVSVRVRPDGMGIIPWGCDQDDYGQRELEYVDASDYQIDPPQTTETG